MATYIFESCLIIGWNFGLSTPLSGFTTIRSSVTGSSSNIVYLTGAKCF